MPIEIACPGCRLLLRADDEFAGESAPCPYCGANIAVPNPQPTGITETRAHQRPPPNERVRRDSREGNSFPRHRRLPIPEHGELRPVDALEPDEDRPPRPISPFSPRTLAVIAFLSMIVCCLVYWGVALWHFEEQPYQAAAVGLCGWYFLVWEAKNLRKRWAKRQPIDDMDEDSIEGKTPYTEMWTFWSFVGLTIWGGHGRERVTVWSCFWSCFLWLLAYSMMYGSCYGSIIVLAIPLGLDLAIYLVVPPRYWQNLDPRSNLDSSRRTDELG